MKHTFSKSAFTLVELIVVITILAILGTIGFISLQGYSVNARDSVRIADTKTYIKALNIYQTKEGQVPLPDNMTTITGSGVVFSYQGTLSGSVITALKQGAVPLDPALKEPYLYATNDTQTKFQLLSYMEKNTSVAGLSSFGAHAADSYADYFPRVIGDEIGFVLNSDNTNLSGSGYELSNLDSTKKVFVNAQKVFLDPSDFYKHASLTHPELAQFDESLIGFWDFKTLEDDKLYDWSHNKNLAVCYDGHNRSVPCVTDASGIMNFDGIDDYVQLESIFSYYGTGGVTFYVKGQLNVISATGNHDAFLGNYCNIPKGPPYLGLSVISLGERFGYRDYSIGSDIFWDNYRTQEMFSIAAVASFESSQSQLYVNSTLLSSAGLTPVGSEAESQCPFQFAKAYGSMGPDSHLNGSLDEIRIYNRPLTPEEISILSADNE